MPKVELTAKVVKDAICTKGQKFEYFMDSIERGFGLQVTASGTKTFIIRFQFKGKRQCRTFAMAGTVSVPAARSRAKYLIAEYLLGNDPLKVEKKNKGLTIKQLYSAWENWIKGRGQWRQETYNIIHSLHNYNINVEKKLACELTVRDLQQYRECRLAKGQKASSINRAVRELKYLYKWGAEYGHLPDTYKFPDLKPLSEALISPKTHHLSEDELTALLLETDEYIREKPSMKYIKPVILFALNTGMRPASICGLEWRDVLRLDTDGGEVRLRAANIKTRKDVNLSISADAANIIRELYNNIGTVNEEDKIFTSCTSSHVAKKIKEIMKRAGLNPEYSAYSLRHNYATSLYQMGCSAVEIQMQMCHASYKSTAKYVHSSYEHQKAVANRLSFGTASSNQAGENNNR